MLCEISPNDYTSAMVYNEYRGDTCVVPKNLVQLRLQASGG